MTKRKRQSRAEESRKRMILDHNTVTTKRESGLVNLPALYYSKVYTLKEFLLTNLPPSSRIRRRRVATFDVDYPEHAGFLEDVTVGLLTDVAQHEQVARKHELAEFTQTQRLHTRGSGANSTRYDISEILGYVIWRLFQEVGVKKPDHLLCHGYHRSNTTWVHDQPQEIALPGIIRSASSTNADVVLQKPWTILPSLLGSDTDSILMSLLIDCGTFQKIKAGQGNLYQVSGKPVFQLSQRTTLHDERKVNIQRHSSDRRQQDTNTNGIAKIAIVRNRMFYARPSINRHGMTQLGLKHIHVFNRYRWSDDAQTSSHILRYIFPRQFGLHNVFTSRVNASETVQPQQDYTFREDEIKQFERAGNRRVPPRLRGAIALLARNIHRNHSRCSYSQLVRYYCPNMHDGSYCGDVTDLASQPLGTQSLVTQLIPSLPARVNSAADQPPDESFIPYATPASRVTAFCQAVLRKLLPPNTFGSGEDGHINWSHLMNTVDRFVQMQRFETTTLHDIMQGIKISCIKWLRPSSMEFVSKPSATDTAKRRELLLEFVYFIFDSFVIPLIRSNFYVTESGLHRNKMFYFRHDLWKKMSEPALIVMRTNMFTPLRSRRLRLTLEASKLGYSQVRLLPKEKGVRPITNLRRRMVRTVNGRRVLGPSINAQLTPTFNVLNYERSRDSSQLGSAMFSVGDVQHRLKSFRANFPDAFQEDFLFVKVDVQSCFDTIPQEQLLRFLNGIIHESEYCTTKHAEVKMLTGSDRSKSGRTMVKFVGRAKPENSKTAFSLDLANQMAGHRRRTTFVNTDQERTIPRQQIQRLLQEHIQGNVVRIGKKHFKQVNGIPQGSILSSLLCSWFYADFEKQHLGFLDTGCSILLRLVDDFLLVTTKAQQARQFVETMSRRHIGYGINISTSKSLANFELRVGSSRIPQVQAGSQFPYCGLLINTSTLEVGKDRHKKDLFIENALTVDVHGRVGNTFQRRVAASLTLQLQTLLLDKQLNGQKQITVTLLESFMESAMKMHRYRMRMPQAKRPGSKLMIDTCRLLTIVANRMIVRAQHGAGIDISKRQVIWLGATAMGQVLRRKQSEYKDVLLYLDAMHASNRSSMDWNQKALDEMMYSATASFQGYVY